MLRFRPTQHVHPSLHLCLHLHLYLHSHSHLHLRLRLYLRLYLHVHLHLLQAWVSAMTNGLHREAKQCQMRGGRSRTRGQRGLSIS